MNLKRLGELIDGVDYATSKLAEINTLLNSSCFRYFFKVHLTQEDHANLINGYREYSALFHMTSRTLGEIEEEYKGLAAQLWEYRDEVRKIIDTINAA